jgi:hypothetical protein
MGTRLNILNGQAGRALGALALAAALGVCGCEKSAPVPAAVQSHATTAPSDVAVNPATQPADTFLVIDGKMQEFPPAVLQMRAKDGQVSALLCTLDPPEALRDDYQGNSFYFPMTLEIPDGASIGAAEWKFQAATTQHVDSLNGIRLHGANIELQPLDVVVDFAGSEPKVTVSMHGRFLAGSIVSAGPTTLPSFSQVIGTFDCQASEQQ